MATPTYVGSAQPQPSDGTGLLARIGAYLGGYGTPAYIGPGQPVLTPDAPPETRTAGIAACRAVLAALEAAPGAPMVTTTVAAPTPIAQIFGALRGVPPEQLLDLAIMKLRAALPAGAEAPTIAPLKFQLLPVPTTQGGPR